MRVDCAWCGKTITEGPEGDISHGICVTCRDKAMSGLEKPSNQGEKPAAEADIPRDGNGIR